MFLCGEKNPLFLQSPSFRFLLFPVARYDLFLDLPVVRRFGLYRTNAFLQPLESDEE